MDFDLKLQFFATTTFLGGGSLIVTLYLKPPRAYFLHKNNYQKSFQLKIPILGNFDCSAIYVHAMIGSISIWD